MITQLLKELIKQQDHCIILYVQTTTRSMSILHIDEAKEDFIKVELTNGTTAIINSKFIEYFTIELSSLRDTFETSDVYLQDLLDNFHN